ncbi:hypothetical protein DFP72DRAFT_1092342 [Ephemerocybe angulata]|uniref:Uncharacterized protein n=1 Tax=Ephemerocybe angulata TaxID=980116 RepID=A0A8H6I8Q2_9AGAR|nr:hypothetical protein DFP72DRAFT_1092342 [Tulosesus angulatus]
MAGSTSTMPDLPSELIELIVDHLHGPSSDAWNLQNESLNSLSLTARQFVPHCQKHIFARICLQRGTIYDKQYYDPTEGLDYTAMFSDLIENRPDLGKYVKHLIYRLPLDIPQGDDANVIVALENMPNVVEFRLVLDDYSPFGLSTLAMSTGFGSPKELLTTQHFRRFPKHANAIKSIIQSEKLTSLTLRNVCFPAGTIPKSTKLAQLNLQSAQCHTRREASYGSEQVPVEGSNAVYLTSFKCTGSASLSGLKAILDPEPITMLDIDAPISVVPITCHFPFQFSRLETLALAISTHPAFSRGTFGVDKLLLSQTESLRQLHLQSVDAYALESLIHEEYTTSPLRSLHPGSYATLARLTLSSKVLVYYGFTTILDPYNGFFADDAILNLDALKELRVEVWISSPRLQMVDPLECGGYRWDQVDEVVGSQGVAEGRLKNLKCVAVTIGVENVDHNAHAKGWLDYVNVLIFKFAFGRLKEMNDDKVLDLVLSTGVRGRRFDSDAEGEEIEGGSDE